MFVNKRQDKFHIINFRLNLQKVEQIEYFFEQNNISPVLIKGLAAAINYPKPFQRVFSDIDLAVDPDQYEMGLQIIKEHKLNVDLHKGLRHLDTLSWEELFKNSRIIDIGGTEIRVLRYEDHLRVLCVHWLNDGGADRTRLWDIYFALTNAPVEFCWERFYGVVNDRRKKWLTVALLIVEQYLGLEIKKTGIPIKDYRLPIWVINELEMEWKNDIRLQSLSDVTKDKKMLLAQILKRFPPNGLHSIIDTEGEIKNVRNYILPLKNIIKRAKPYYKRNLK